MNAMHNPGPTAGPSSPLVLRLGLWQWTASGVLAAALVACGGGGAGDSTGGTTPLVAGTGSYTSGAITGFGSIIVNGVRFDDSGAHIEDDDGVTRSSSDLKLGAHVEIEASRIDRNGGTGTATVIRYGSELKGAVAEVNSATSSFTMLGQTVEVSSTTVFDSTLTGGLSALGSGSNVEVHAQFDAARSVYVATRVEAASALNSYTLRGQVAQLDPTAKTFNLGTTTYNYATATNVPTTLANGTWVRLSLLTAPVNGQWVVSSFKSSGRHHDSSHSEAETKGLITAFTSSTAFSVDGVPVDATAASFPDGTAGLVLGAQVEVEGALVNGVLVATKVHLEDESHHGRGEDYELHGTLSALDASAKTFSLRGLTVSYASATFSRGTEASLANNVRVEVKGDLSSDGSKLTASAIKFE